MYCSRRFVRRALAASSITLATGFLGAAVAFAAPVTQTITTIAGNGADNSSGDGGVAVKASIDDPTGVAESLTGTLYIADSGGNKVRAVVSPTTINSDIISTFAGTGKKGFAGDGGPATRAELAGPTGLAVDSKGDVFIADTLNNRVREVLPNGTIETVAGNGTCSILFVQGNGKAATSASLCRPTGVAVDSAGNLYISDTGHNEIRVVNATTHVISDFAGNGLCIPLIALGDGGPATALLANLCGPTGVAVGTNGTVYIADTGHSQVRSVSHGIINDFAGVGVLAGYSGDGGPAAKACLKGPTGIGIDSLGDVYISDTGNNRLRVVNAAGVIFTSAGNGTDGFSGDGGPATAAALDAPTGAVAVDGTAVYFSDSGNNRVRGVFNGPPPVLPESAWAVALPIGAAMLLGLGLIIVRRRRTRMAVSGGVAG